MIQDAYVIYESLFAMKCMAYAYKCPKMIVPKDVHYISNEVALANMEKADQYMQALAEDSRSGFS